MKAVVYHADAHFPTGEDVGDTYRNLFKGFVANCHKFNMKVIHVTLDGNECWGDEPYYVYGLNPKNVMANREVAFTQFLEDAPEDIYWFTEPDYRITKAWPRLNGDCCLLYRNGDDVPMTPSWRMANKKALPLFKELRDEIFKVPLREGVGLDWHCDSEAFTSVWRRMHKPSIGNHVYRGMKVEFRNYYDYIKGGQTVYGRNYAADNKKELLERERSSEGPGTT